MNHSDRNPLVFVGVYNGAEHDGIFTFRLDLASGALTPVGNGLETRNASYLAWHPDGVHLYAVNEVASQDGIKGGTVSAFILDSATGALRFINRQPSQGTSPCHLCVAAGGRSILVANYGSGTVGVLPVEADGRLGPARQTIQHEGRGLDPVRQKHAHAHAVAVDPTGCFALVCDLGIDRVMVYRFDPERGLLQPNDPPWVQLRPGAGPRHLVFAPGGRRVYVVNELDSTVAGFAFNPATGVLTAGQTVSTLPADFVGVSACAAIRLHPGGRFLYVSNRGHDSIAVFGVDPATGVLEPAGHVASGGRTPRDFALDPSGAFLLAANQDSNTIAVFRVDPATGRPEPTGRNATLPKPVCVVFG